jgi:hypothetical protein
MQTASPEVLIGFMVVLGLTAIGLMVWMVRFLVRGQRQKRKVPAESPPSVERPLEAEEGVVGQMPTAIPDAVTRPVTEHPAPAGRFAEPSHTPSPAPSLRGAAQVAQQRKHAPVRPGDTLLMQVWQDRDGYLVVEVDGQRYRRLFDVRDGAVGRRVMETINRLVVFSRGQESRAAAPPPSASQPQRDAPQRPAPAPAFASSSSDEIIEEQSQEFLEQLRQQEEVEPKKSRISADPVPFRRRSEAQERSITLNLASEIDQMLQIRIRASPEFSGRYVRVADTPDGGLRFEVDGARYSGLDEIPDPQVRALVRAAISDWEARR